VVTWLASRHNVGVPTKPRLVDVAEQAGVSMKTVSNVINEFPHVSPGTRAKVQAAIDVLGYRPNQSARNLARGLTGTIALVVPQLDMPYFAALSMQVLEAAEQAGWMVIIQQTRGDLTAERAIVHGHSPHRLDGMIFSPVRIGPTDLRDREDSTPLVLLGEQTYPGVADHVAVDNVAAARTAVQHLIGLGRRRVAMVGARTRNRQNPRFRGYLAALRAAGLEVDDALHLPAPNGRGTDGEAAIHGLLDRGVEPPDAVFCMTDWVALGVVRALQQRGLRVPEDVAVVGFDDIPYGLAATPTLTTVSTDREQIAGLAVQSLLDQLAARRAGTEFRPSERTAGFRLVVRESTAGRSGSAPGLHRGEP